MNKYWRWVLIVSGGLVILTIFGPLLLPYPRMADLYLAEAVQDADSRFVEVDGVSVHYKERGDPNGPLILLLHGFGASTYSWEAVIDELAEYGHVVAYDRPAFGLTDRPMPDEWEGISPYGEEWNVKLVIALMDHFGAGQAILIGNSAGGRVALATAVEYPQRVRGLVLVDAAYGESKWGVFKRVVFLSPQMRKVGPILVRSISKSGVDTIYRAWSDPSLVTDAVLTGYQKPLQIQNWDRALWEFQRAGQRPAIDSHFVSMMLPVLVVSGADDQIIPLESSEKLAEQLGNAQLEVFEQCGHVPHEECPERFMSVVGTYLAEME